MRANSTTDPFFGHSIETAIVTRDHRRTMEGLWRLGIGSWRVHTFNPQNTTNQSYHGKPSPFVLVVCFAEAGNLTWELIEPLSGSTIFADFLERHGEGVHVAYNCNSIPLEERITEDATACLETYVFPDDRKFSERFIKAPIVAESNQILGVVAFAVDADEIMGAVQVAIAGRLRYTALREAIVTHPN